MSEVKPYEVKFMLTRWNNECIPPHEEITVLVRAYTAEDAAFQARVNVLHVHPGACVKEPHGRLETISAAPAKEDS